MRWETAPLGRIAKFQGGGTPSKDNARYWTGNIPWVSPKDMKAREIGSSIDKITKEAIENSAASLIPEGAILVVVRSGILARTIPIAMTTRELAVNQDIKAICPQKGLDGHFLLYYLQSSEQRVLQRVTRSATVHRLETGVLRDLEIPLPPLPEQRRIVSILDETFAGLEAMRANAEKNLQNARDLFESYLASVFANSSASWQHRRLHEIAKDFGRGKSKHRPRNDPKLYGGPYPFIQTGDVRNSNHLISSYTQTYNDIGLSQSKLWPKGTLCITIAANIAETGVLEFDACFPDSVIGFVANETMTSSKFVEYLLQSYKARLQREGKGSAQDNINLGTFEGKVFPFPDLPTQRQIARSFDSLNADCVRLAAIYEQKLAAIDELKQSILQKAFAGELTSAEVVAA